MSPIGSSSLTGTSDQYSQCSLVKTGISSSSTIYRVLSVSCSATNRTHSTQLHAISQSIMTKQLDQLQTPLLTCSIISATWILQSIWNLWHHSKFYSLFQKHSLQS